MKYILWISVIYFFTIIFVSAVTGIALTIKYAYIDEIIHYHTNTCYINDCTKTISECCTDHVKTGRTCRTCYRIDVNYNLSLSNQSYSKTSVETVYYSDFCDQKSLNCYYDDRNIFESLRLLTEYLPTGGIIGIVLLSILLFMMTMIIVTATIFFVRNKNQFIEYAELNINL